MLRNREIQILLFTMVFISLTVATVAIFVAPTALVLTILVSTLLISSCFIYTKWRYSQIEKLSEYLRRISAGNFSLDVRENREGELSILKNEIYKVTIKLSEQSELLKKDKIKLTNAISDISHQLKTPLTSMMIMSDLLSEDRLPMDKRSEFTNNIRLQLERIDWLVSSLLKLSKIDAGTELFKQEPVILNKLIQKALEPLLIPIDIKDLNVSIHKDENISFWGDFNWTTEALINILKNCVEHTPNGGQIEIFLSENPLFTEIVITDNGIGIANDDLRYIFKRFYKGKNASEGSIGIGLAMSYSIIKNQNGTIEVKSKLGEGTQFRIKFYKQVF
ncbi:HAMP domain-containing sensor histidine kinase [Gottfriedia acidiceleris]|uniref:HAMP domain-containing sensor histidine kinase n=1 Tax=Gottfriedia acidiceleris TaxID=371036 RepID=UPI003D1A8E93